ncbi:hypothetical protein [Thalassiella azotivora]
MMVLLVTQTVVLVVLCVLVAGLLRGYAEVLRRLHRLDGGEEPQEAGVPPFRTVQDVAPPAPAVHSVQRRDEWAAASDVSGTTPDGEIVHVRTVGVEHDTLLAFLSSGCTGCVGFWDELARPGSWALPEGTRLLVVSKGPQEESPGLLEQLRPRGVDVVMSSEAWDAYDVPGSPYVVVVDGRTGRVKGQGSGSSFTQMSGLVAQAAGDSRALRKPTGDLEREADVDRILLEAGIEPGHPSLYGGVAVDDEAGRGVSR